jgi:hypothetical protein
MKRLISILIWIMLIVCACQPVAPTSEPPQTETPAPPTATPDVTPSVTPTAIEVAGPKEGDKTVVTENGYTYEYTYTKIGETPDGEPIFKYLREIANFCLIDDPVYNYIPFQIFIADGVLGERSILELLHRDFVRTDIPPGGTFDPNPITGAFVFELEKTYFQNDQRNLSLLERDFVFQNEMLGKGEDGHKQAYLPIKLSNGDEVDVKLSQDNGIKMTIMDVETILKLGGASVTEWTYVDPASNKEFRFFSEAYGLDEKGNLLVRFALDGSFDNPDLSEEALRIAFMSIPANFAQKFDQSEQGVTDFAITLGHQSAKKQRNSDAIELDFRRASDK